MAYLRDREHDVFLSYAHVDNTPEREDEKGWVEQLERLLSVRLLKRFGKPVDVWRDPKLGRAQLFDPVIEAAVRGSGVLVALISRSSLESDYCGQEIEWFREQAEGGPHGLVIDGYLRVFPVLLYNIPPGEWPKACQGTSGFSFHDAAGDDFGEPLDPASTEFGERLRQLVEELHTVLERLQEDAPPPAVEDEGSFRVFLSHPADDLGAARRQLAAALEGKRIDVLDGIPPPYDDEEHADAVRAAVEKADLTVHLLGDRPGEPLSEDEPGRTYPVEQLNLGLEHARSQLVLLPEGLDVDLVEEASYADLLRSLGERERDAARFELIRTGRRQMLDAVLAKRRRIEAEVPQAAGGTAFIDLHTQDIPYATELVSYLVQQRITPLMVPSAEVTPALELFEENLRRASLFLVVFGTVARSWVEHRLEEAFKLILSAHLDTTIGIYVAPPEKDAAEIRFPFPVANNTGGFDPGTLEPLLAKEGTA